MLNLRVFFITQVHIRATAKCKIGRLRPTRPASSPTTVMHLVVEIYREVIDKSSNDGVRRFVIHVYVRVSSTSALQLYFAPL